MSYTTDDNTLSNTQSSSVGFENLLLSLQKIDIFSRMVSGSSSFDNKDHRDQTQIIHNIREEINQAGSGAGYVWFEVFKAVYRGRVRLNAWTGELVLDGKIVTPEALIDKLEQALKMLMKLTREQFERKFQVWIEGCTFNPVRKELESIVRDETHKWIFPGTDPSTLNESAQFTNRKYEPIFNNAETVEKLCSCGGYQVKELEPMADWNNLANILFGTEDALSQIMLEKWLISAVVRAMQPGEQADYSLVLKGKQGAGKSTFFRLMGGEYFLDLDNSTDGTEVKRQLDRAWIVEMGEMEGITRKKEVEELKAFLTKTSDTFRGLYERKPSVHPRHVVFGGTCNSDEILRDPTGSRRFWIIDLGDRKVNRDYLVENRDSILATAYLKWQQGFTWYPDDQMSEQSEDRNKNYQEVNEWTQKVNHSLAKLQGYIDSKNTSGKSRVGYQPYDGLSINLSAFMEHSLNLHVTLHRSCNKKITQALGELGYTKKRLTLADGSRPWVYIKQSVQNPFIVDSSQLEQMAEWGR
ncbi:virulence-associated E family protein [Nostoc sp. ATCC 53789]|uniref:virulence-associated E family protein n=1 Tax=Nostoc sp. ATCC 53789 TaxID=76335 RepID=UPI0013319C63|nr:virulence-associated E family protein [Nostoc sp. ATCC 53789]